MGRFRIRKGQGEVMKQKIHLDIKGMTCASCVNRIEKGLMKSEAISSVSVNLATEGATVEYDPEKIKVSNIISLVEKIGYHALAHSETDRKFKVPFQQQHLVLLLSSLLTLPLVLPMLTAPFGMNLSISPWWQCILATPVQFVF